MALATLKTDMINKTDEQVIDAVKSIQSVINNAIRDIPELA
jgi:hypothetical protein